MAMFPLSSPSCSSSATKAESFRSRQLTQPTGKTRCSVHHPFWGPASSWRRWSGNKGGSLFVGRYTDRFYYNKQADDETETRRRVRIESKAKRSKGKARRKYFPSLVRFCFVVSFYLLMRQNPQNWVTELVRARCQMKKTIVRAVHN